MTPALRQWHRWIWPCLFLTLLALGAAAYQVLPEQAEAVVLTNQVIHGNGVLVSRTPSANTQSPVLEVKLTQPLQEPAVLLYASLTQGQPLTASKLLGRLESVGVYEFPIDPEMMTAEQLFLIAYDPVRKKTAFNIVHSQRKTK